MPSELVELQITAREIERHSGQEVSEIFVGSAFAGLYRPSVFRNRQKLLTFGLLELALTALFFIFCLPLGLAFMRGHTSPWLFMIATGTATGGIVSLRHLYRLKLGHRFGPLMVLLDEIDQFNDMIQAVAVLERLGTIQPGAPQLVDRSGVVEVLQLTRENLVAGLVTEKILRDNRGLMLRRQELIANIEQNLATLGKMARQSSADEYSNILNESLQIGLRVREEMVKLSGQQK
jgi:hypothetical protein